MQRVVIRFLVGFIFINPIIILAQNWSSVNQFPYSGVHHPITFSNDSCAYVVSGSNTNNVYKYYKDTDSWTQLADFPGGDRGYACGVATGDKAYIGFGSDPIGQYPTDWWEYNMSNDIWTQLASFPSLGRDHPALILVNNKIYMGCGSDNNGNLNDWWEYDIGSNIWAQKTNLPGNERHHPFYFSIGDDAYIGFGHGSVSGIGSNPSSSSFIYNDFYKYSSISNNWVQLSNFPSEARVAGTQFSYNGKGYILSGDGDDHGPLDEGEFWEYNPINDNWIQLSSHPGDAIWAPGCFVIGCDVYFLLGENTNTFPGSFPSNIYKYKLSQDCGCTDSSAVNFSAVAIFNDGSCCYFSGCTDPLAINYDSLACYDDGSCITPILGCTDNTAINYNPQANTTITNGGALDNSFSTGGYFLGNQHLIFDANTSCIIRSAKFYSNTNNTVTFELRDNNGNVLDDTSHTIVSGTQVLSLNFEVPVGNDMQLGISSNNSGLYRNNSGAVYPYNIGGLINISGSSASQPGYYYFYYDIKVETPCIILSTNNSEIYNKKKCIKIVDILGKEVGVMKKQPLFYIYDDGTVEKRITIE